MSNIYSSPAFLKKALERAIVEATDSRNMEHKPEKGHFTRKSALSMDTMVRLLLSMSGGFLDKELEEAGHQNLSWLPRIGRRWHLHQYGAESQSAELRAE